MHIYSETNNQIFILYNYYQYTTMDEYYLFSTTNLTREEQENSILVEKSPRGLENSQSLKATLV